MTETKNNSAAAKNQIDLFYGEGEMASLMRAYSWNSHPMGKPEQWPESLKTTIRLMLQSNFPMFIWWSRDLFMFHNDAYLPALGKKHPHALGASAREMWAEIWEQIGDIVEGILKEGKPFYAKELQMFLERKGFSEETYWTFSYSPAPDDSGGVGGIFCACNEVTNSVLGQRRLKVIKDVADATVQVTTVEEASRLTSQVLSKNTDDIPFSLIYLLNNEGTKAKLVGQSGRLSPEWAPEEVGLQQADSRDTWALGDVWHSKKAKVTHKPLSKKQPQPAVDAVALPEMIVTLPVMKPGEDRLIGFFVSAVSPKLEYNADYRNFHELLIGQIATSIAGVQAREEVVRQQEELIGLFEQAPVAIAILRGEKLVVELANSNMCQFWGRSHGEVINKPVFDALPEVRGQGLEELLQDVLHTGASHSFSEFELMIRRNGEQEKVYVNFIYYPFRDARGVIRGVTAIAVEVSEQVEARYEIETKNNKLMAINADLDNFVYSASHDLKGPILNVEGLMKVLLQKLPVESLQPEGVAKVIQMIFGSIDRLKDTITDLSEVVRVQKEADEDVRIVDIRDVVTDVVSDMELTIQETSAVIQFEFETCPIRFSPKNLRSIIYNLLSNAIKYRSPSRKPLIRLTCEEIEGEVLFAVHDNGLGINMKYESKIFSMFKRLHSHGEGTGIGLYIVKRIIENAGGRITVESEVDKGSTFSVYFPRIEN